MQRVMVGVDGSEGSSQALRWAFEEGKIRDWPVVAVLVWDLLHQPHPKGTEPFRPDFDEAAARAALDEIVRGVLGEEAPRVERLAICDLAVPGLLGAVDDGDLLVVGARGLGGFKGILLGSVSEACVRHAPCPVVVVRGAADAG
jgi:nucleotide-binding universal stress UspA family protein